MVTKTNVKITHNLDRDGFLIIAIRKVAKIFFWGGWCEVARTIHRLSTCYTIDEIIVMK